MRLEDEGYHYSPIVYNKFTGINSYELCSNNNNNLIENLFPVEPLARFLTSTIHTVDENIAVNMFQDISMPSNLNLLLTFFNSFLKSY